MSRRSQRRSRSCACKRSKKAPAWAPSICQGVAGALLDRVCADMARRGVSTLYLVTDHTSFYERYGWEFLCMVQETEAPRQIRMYRRRT